MLTRFASRIAVLAGLAATAAALTACTADAAPDQASPSRSTLGSSAPASSHNAADAYFARLMVVHHQDAVAMAEVAVERAQSEEVRALAERMIVGRRAQIETLTTLSAEWHKEPPAAAGPELDHAGLGIEDLDHRGVMDELEAASGPAFDQRFLQLMSAHHRGAITMAEEQRAQGQAPDALALAASMIDEHHRDIAVMERLATEP